jgi:hypothetical protein
MPTTLLNEFEPTGTPLVEVVEVRRRFLRSVNLEQDFYSADPLDGYLLTSSGFAALERITEGVKHIHARAFSITGSYGSGKSAFTLFASKILAADGEPEDSPRRRVIAQFPVLRSRLPENAREGFLPVLLTGTRAPVARTLLLGLFDALINSPLAEIEGVVRRLQKEFKPVLSEPAPTSAEVVRVYARAAEMVKKSISGCLGLLVVVDEMGKFLEYAALHPEQGDLQLFQELAEHAARSETAPLMLVTILHQAFEEYAFKLSATQRREWQKIQGRFIDIPFADRADETVALIAQAITHREAAAQSERLEQTINANMEWCRRLHHVPPRLSASEFRELLRTTYPIHPLTLSLMPHAFRRFGQSERSLFSFLSSDEPYGFQEFLRGHMLTAKDAPMLRPDHLYDYITQTLSSVIYAHSTAKLWSETEEAIYRLRDKDPVQSRLVKTIGLLHILGEQTDLLPSKEILQFALSDSTINPEDVELHLEELKSATLIVYRQFKQAYRLYEGSEVDVEARLRDAHAHFAQGTDSVQVATRLEVTPPIVARQHSYRTGTLRIFEVRHCRPANLESEIRVGRGQGDGAMLLCLATDAEQLAGVKRIATEFLSTHPEIVLGVSLETDALHEAAVAVDCLLWVQKETPELAHDRVATREIRERLVEATQAFREEWDRLLRPQGIANEGGGWYHEGEPVSVSSHRELQRLVSQACDIAYPMTPVIQNELINRRQLSSTAAAARRNIIEAMILRRNQPRLGIEGFPPEASMYISVLENTGIHRQIDSETWAIQPPLAERDAALLQVWNEMERFLFSNDLESKSLTLLNTILRAKPYGLAEGITQVLICAILLYYDRELALYEDGRFITELDSATFERMIKRPADFKLRGCRIVGERQTVLDRFARGLLRTDEEPTLINVVRKLYREFNRLPEYTERTKRLSDEATALRDIFKESREPENLLFVELPRLFGLRPFREEDPDIANVAGFFEKWNSTMLEVMGAYSQLLSQIENKLCMVFEVRDWEELRGRAATIHPYVAEPKLTGFTLRASNTTLSREKWLETVGAGVMSRPPANWSDKEEERFGNQLSSLAAAFQHSELLHFEKQKHSSTETQTGIRVAVTQDTGEESARVVLVSKADTGRVEQLSARLRQAIDIVLQNEPQEIHIAALAQIMQEMLQRKQKIIE